MKKVVLTGAPHSGKTTLIEELLERGHLVIPETAITVIETLNNLLGLHGALNWRRKHFSPFQELISKRQHYLEDAISEGDRLVFLDRGAHDGIAFARYFHKMFPDKASAYVNDARYDQVFLLDLVLPFDNRSDSGRIENTKDCLEIQQHLFDVYSEIGLEPTTVPFLPVDERIDFILKEIGQSSPTTWKNWKNY